MSIAPHDEREQVDMGEAPHVQHFYGRVDELAVVKRWIVDEHCRLVSIIGVGGIGKTSLVAKLIDQERPVFRAVFWRTLLNAPPLERILRDCLQFLTRIQQIEVPQDTEEQMRLLLTQLQERRCLLVLDNAEAVLKSGSATGEYKDGYEGYGKLVRLLGEARHQSCLLVTSREQLKEIAWLEGEETSVHSYRLGGLNANDARVILERKGLSGEERSWKDLVERFAGNPMMLTIISPTIRESYRGLISQYLVEFSDVPLNEYPDLRVLLYGQFERLSHLEQQVIYWLAIEREAVSLQDLRENFVQPVSKASMLTAIEALQRRSWIEQSGSGRFTLQPAMMDAVTDRFTERVVQEIVADQPELFASHALMKAQAKDYIRRSQFQLIPNVIAQKLFTKLDRSKLEEKFRRRLVALRNLPEEQDNYEAGNILNLLVQTGSNLRGADFSRLVVRQAYLQEAELPGVSFAHANLATSVFSDTFGSIFSVVFSPRGDLLAAGTATGEIRFWHVASGLPLQTIRGHTDWVRSVAFSPDGGTLASGSEDWVVHLWEVSSGKLLHTLRSHSHWVRSVTFSPDGKILASGSNDQTVCLWEVNSGQCLNTLHGHASAVSTVAFSPDGEILASGSEDHAARLWEVSSGRCLKTLHGHASAVSTVAFSPDGKILASGSEDRAVRLWEVNSGKSLNTLHGHTNTIWSVAFSPDGKTLASGSDDQTMRLWEMSSGKSLRTLYGYTNMVWSVAFSPDGRTLASGSDDQAVRLWEMSSDRCLYILQGHVGVVRSVAFSPDGKTLASGSDDQTVCLWEVNSGKLLHTLHGHSHWVWSVAFSPDGKTLASSSYDRTVCLWEVSSGKLLHTLRDHSYWVTSVAFSPDGKALASGSCDQTVRLWEVSGGKLLHAPLSHAGAVTSVAFSPDGRTLASGSEDQAMRLWDVSRSKLLKTLHSDSPVESVVFSPDGRTLASGSDDQTVRQWEVSSGKLLKTLHGHSSAVLSVAFSPDGKALASGSYDQTARLWEVSSGKLLHTLRGHSHCWVRSVAFSPDGKTLASGGYDGVISLWDRQTGACLRTLRIDRPYERMNITQMKGLTVSQKATLKLLGAIEEEGQELV
jgi:WD40 repeat protein